MGSVPSPKQAFEREADARPEETAAEAHATPCVEDI